MSQVTEASRLPWEAYRAPDAARILGVSEPTLLAWGRANRLRTWSYRRANGYLSYFANAADVDRLASLGARFDGGWQWAGGAS